MAGDVEGSLLGVSDGLVEKDVGGWWSEMAVDGWWVVKVEVGRDGDRMAGCVALSLVQEVGAVEVFICFPRMIVCISPQKRIWVRWGD